ncbi:DUF1778 domain-containing protein [Bifidobacterium lemurum]|nr:DUF1778 domain-containing protein [Bifidobacterium lemurum]QOL34477.1 DUF1778 domain-containing protein [Bifidobacterium lemurum]
MNLRLTDEQKSLIERAAALRDMSLTQWSVGNLVDSARRDIENATTLRLSDEVFDAFLKALDEPMPQATRDLLDEEPIWA